jgi:hypothetical protein
MGRTGYPAHRGVLCLFLVLAVRLERYAASSTS